MGKMEENVWVKRLLLHFPATLFHFLSEKRQLHFAAIKSHFLHLLICFSPFSTYLSGYFTSLAASDAKKIYRGVKVFVKLLCNVKTRNTFLNAKKIQERNYRKPKSTRWKYVKKTRKGKKKANVNDERKKD